MNTVSSLPKIKPDEKLFKEFLGSLTENGKEMLFTVSPEDLQDYYSSLSCDWAVRIISRVTSLPPLEKENGEWKVFACWDCQRTFLEVKECEKHIKEKFLQSAKLPTPLVPQKIELQWFTMMKCPTLWAPLDHHSGSSSTKTNLLERKRILYRVFEQLQGLSDNFFLCHNTCVRILDFCKQYIPPELVSGPESLCYLPLQQLEMLISFLEFLANHSWRHGGGKVLRPLEKQTDSDYSLVLQDGLFHLVFEWTVSDQKKLNILYNPSVDKKFSDWEPKQKNLPQNPLVDQEFTDWDPKLQNLGTQFLEKLPETYSKALELCQRKNNILKYMDVLESVLRKCVDYSKSKEWRHRSFKFLLQQQISVPQGNDDSKILLQVLSNILKENRPDPPTEPKNVSHLFVSEACRSLHILELGEEAHRSYSHLRGAMLQEYLTKDLQVMELDLDIYQMLSKHLFYHKNISKFTVISYNNIIEAMVKLYIREKLKQVFQTTKAAKKTRKQKIKEEQAGNKKDVVIKHNVVQSVLVTYAEEGEMTQEEEMLSQGMTRISLNNKRSKGKKH